MKTCTIPGCGRIEFCKKLCQRHYCKLLTYGDPLMFVNVPAAGVKCSVQGCNNTCKATGMCSTHYQRLKKYGDATRAPMRRPNGSGAIRKDGYIVHRIKNVDYLEHILIAQKSLGRPLPKGVEIHHVDEDRANNIGTNLVICPTGKYHKLLHSRARAYDACGNASWRKCWICRQWDDPLRLRSYNGKQPHHRDCHNRYLADRSKQKRAAA